MAKIANISAEEMAKMQNWTKFNIKISAKADEISGVMGAFMESIHQAIRTAELEESEKAAQENFTPSDNGGMSIDPSVPAPMTPAPL